jgi:mRNA-degrading endonuclease RelE of RelBE toxin-antitoxin system
MQYRRTRTFRKDYDNLPENIQEIVKKKFRLLQKNPIPPYHPSLRIKPMKGWEGIFEGHITGKYVFTFHKDNVPKTGETVFVFRRIGSHDIYKHP